MYDQTTHNECRMCNEIKTIDNFTITKKLLPYSYCNKCNYERTKKYITPESSRAGFKNFMRSMSKEEYTAYCKNSALKHKYGINLEYFNKMREQQDYKCAICGDKEGTMKKALHVDHCHKTKQVRGLLCFRCNGAIGSFREDVSILKNAINYLFKYREPTKEEIELVKSRFAIKMKLWYYWEDEDSD